MKNLPDKSKTILGAEKFCDQKCWVKKNVGPKNFGSKRICVKIEFWIKNFFWSKNIGSKKNFVSQKFWSNKMLFKKCLIPPKMAPKTSVHKCMHTSCKRTHAYFIASLRVYDSYMRSMSSISQLFLPHF